MLDRRRQAISKPVDLRTSSSVPFLARGLNLLGWAYLVQSLQYVCLCVCVCVCVCDIWGKWNSTFFPVRHPTLDLSNVAILRIEGGRGQWSQNIMENLPSSPIPLGGVHVTEQDVLLDSLCLPESPQKGIILGGNGMVHFARVPVPFCTNPDVLFFAPLTEQLVRAASGRHGDWQNVPFYYPSETNGWGGSELTEEYSSALVPLNQSLCRYPPRAFKLLSQLVVWKKPLLCPVESQCRWARRFYVICPKWHQCGWLLCLLAQAKCEILRM